MESERRLEVDQFLLDRIDTVPHLEALLLLWNGRSRTWSAEDMSSRLFVPADAARDILEDLLRQSLAVRVPKPPESYRYSADPHVDDLMSRVDAMYRRELVRVSRLIHDKGSAAVREFARAFRLKKERE